VSHPYYRAVRTEDYLTFHRHPYMRVRVRGLNAKGEENACNESAPTFTHALLSKAGVPRAKASKFERARQLLL